MDITHNPFKGMSKPEKIAVVAGTSGIAAYLVYSHHKKTGSWNPWSSASSTSAGVSGTAIDPVTGLAYSQDNAIDPITGLAYLAEATQYGSVSTAEASVSAYGASTASGSGIGVNPASPPPAGSPNPVVGSSVYTSNAAWAQAATAGLTDVGYSATDVAAALGDYLTGTPVTAAQASLINTAIAEYGPAPSGGLQIILAPVSTPSPTPVPTPTPTPKPVTNPMSQTGTVHSATTGETGDVNTTNGGKTWNYIGTTPKAGQPKNQTGTVHSVTTGLSGSVSTADAGLHWTFTGK